MKCKLLAFNECTEKLVGKDLYLLSFRGCDIVDYNGNLGCIPRKISSVKKDYVQVTFGLEPLPGLANAIAFGRDSWSRGSPSRILPFIACSGVEGGPPHAKEQAEVTLVSFDDLEKLVGKGVFLLEGRPLPKRILTFGLDAPKQKFVHDIDFKRNAACNDDNWVRLYFAPRVVRDSWECKRHVYNAGGSLHRIYALAPLVVEVPPGKVGEWKEALNQVTVGPITKIGNYPGPYMLGVDLAGDSLTGISYGSLFDKGKHPMAMSIEDVVGKPPVKEKKMITQETLKSIADLFVEGVRIHSSAEASNRIVDLVKKQLGESYPKFFATDLGKAIEPALVPTLVYMAASYFEGNEMAKKVRNIASYAIMGSAAGLTDYAAKLLPLFNEIAALSPLLDGTPEYKKHNCKA